jgi:hypothetical protein
MPFITACNWHGLHGLLRRTRQLRALIFADGRGIIIALPLRMIVIANE